MFEFDMQVQRDIRSVDFVAPLVRAREIFLYLYSQPSILFTILKLIQFEVFILQALNNTYPYLQFFNLRLQL